MSQTLFFVTSKLLAVIIKKRIHSTRSTLVSLGVCGFENSSFAEVQPSQNTVQLRVISEVDSLVADGNLRKHHAIISIREPRLNLLANYWREHAFHKLPFQAYIEQQIKAKDFFLSSLHNSWQDHVIECSFLPIDTDIVANTELQPLATYLRAQAAVSITLEPSIVEQMYTAALPKAAQPFLSRSTDGGASSISQETIGRIEKIAIESRPFFEYTKSLELSSLVKSGVLFEGTLPALENYAVEWRNDARSFIFSSKALGSNKAVLGHAIESFELKARSPLILPSENFQELLPVSAEWSAIVRIIAAGACTT